jgi:hypothetical protein
VVLKLQNGTSRCLQPSQRRPLSTCQRQKSYRYPCNGPWKTISVRRRGCHIFLDNRLKDGGEVVSLTHRSTTFTPKKFPGTHFCSRLSRQQSHCAAGRIKEIGRSSDLIGNPTSGFPASSVVPQSSTILRVPQHTKLNRNWCDGAEMCK